ncbi:hypothetical protein [Paratractidigestivibacter sp.]|uniref:hypothetical protein n=1 Tax=Paratractidigestivibacter sp. TaxID=2847316 RepID=UPI002ABE61D8|nr:hypothetical protein [Paratractidigestivibacter sp.]
MPNASHDSAPKALIGAVGFACRVAGWAVTCLVIADLLFTGAARSTVLPLNTLLSRAIPEAISGSLVIATPLGGAFRGDFALVAVLFFVFDWVLCKIASSLR